MIFVRDVLMHRVTESMSQILHLKVSNFACEVRFAIVSGQYRLN